MKYILAIAAAAAIYLVFFHKKPAPAPVFPEAPPTEVTLGPTHAPIFPTW